MLNWYLPPEAQPVAALPVAEEWIPGALVAPQADWLKAVVVQHPLLLKCPLEQP